ncbi:MAG: flagellar hook-length control protein FliK [Paracoccaceae bacterium]
MPTPVAAITPVTQGEVSKSPSKSNASKSEANDGPDFEEVVRDLDAEEIHSQDVLKAPVSQINPEDVEQELSLASVVAVPSEDVQTEPFQIAENPVKVEVPSEIAEQTNSVSDARLVKTDDKITTNGPVTTSSASAQIASVSERMIALKSAQSESKPTSPIEDSKSVSLKSAHNIAAANQVGENSKADVQTIKTSEPNAAAVQQATGVKLSSTSKTIDPVKTDLNPNIESTTIDNKIQIDRIPDAMTTKEQAVSKGGQSTLLQAAALKGAGNERQIISFNDQAPAEKYEMSWPASRSQSVDTASNIVQAAMNSNPASTPAATVAASIQSDLKFNLARIEKNEAREMVFGPADMFDSTAQHLRSVAQVAATRGELPPTLARQVAEALHRSPDKPIELTLSPAELGRVRMTLKGGENSMMVTVLAERPETLDLMRRNIEMLDQAMSDLGYENISFSFEQGGADGSSNNGNETPDQSETKSTSLDLDALPETEISNTPLQSLPINNGGLDVRL